MRTPLACQAEGDYLALEIVSDLLERTHGRNVTLLFVFEPATHRGLDGAIEQAEGDRRRTPKAESAEDAVDATFLPREECELAQGKKVVVDSVAAQTIEAQRPSARSRHQRGHVLRVLEPQVREKSWPILGLTWKDVETVRRRKEKRRKGKRRHRRYKANCNERLLAP